MHRPTVFSYCLTLIFFAGVIAIHPTAAADETEADLFPFVVSFDAPENATNVSSWLKGPAGSEGFVRVEDGHLATDSGPFRIWGTNFCFEACFPTHEEAERVAARLARFGINCVRLHHIDAYHIWGKSPNKTIIDPEMLEKLDYFVFQLKQRGIYVNLNLHVSRHFGEKEGFAHSDKLPKYGKGVDIFEPRMIELQKKYARDFLTHVNLYTKMAYTDDPAVAMVEINNENSMIHSWGQSSLDNLPEPYATTLREQWNAWLLKKYGSTERLQKAWKVSVQPLGEEILKEMTVGQAADAVWTVQQDSESKVESKITADGPDSQASFRLDIQQMGKQPWIPQVFQRGLTVKKDQSYTLSGFLRCDHPAKLSLNCAMNHAPWQPVGLGTLVPLSTEWKRFDLAFVATQDDDNVKISLTGFSPGVYEFASVSLRPGGTSGWEEGSRIEEANVPIVKKSGGSATADSRDFIDFIWDTEQDYWTGMQRFLKEDLGVQSIVAGTQLGWGEIHVQEQMDFIDAHAYWNHPVFPNWIFSLKNWDVRNVALTNEKDGGTLTRLAAQRVAGMPYTVSEYNHPTPNSYAAEGFPMIAAFGRFQNWDGVFSFAYSHDREYEKRMLDTFFDIKSHSPKMAHSIACAALFLRGDVEPARETVNVPMSLQAERDRLHQDLGPWNLSAEFFGLDLQTAMQHAVALDTGASDTKTTGPLAASSPSEELTKVASDTGQLQWNFQDPGAGYFTVDTPRTKVFTGFPQDKIISLGDVRLRIGKSQHGWATISLTALGSFTTPDGEELCSPGRLLLAATGAVQNTGAQLQKLEDDKITLGDKWGKAPLLCEGISAFVLLPVDAKRVRFYPLDESGDRQEAIPVRDRKGQALLQLDPKHRTIWYEIEILP